MRAGLLLLMMLASAVHAEPYGACFAARERATLQASLLELAQHELRERGLLLDATRARLALSAPLPKATGFTARPTWTAAGAVTLPLTFELQACPCSGAVECTPLVATLAAPVLSEQWVASRRLRKGARVACTDLQRVPRLLRDTHQPPLVASCDLPAPSVALREIAAGDVIAATDVGLAPAVMAGTRVKVSTTIGAVSVIASAMALADAQRGEHVPIRLQGSRHVLDGRVVAPSTVELLDTAP